MDPYPVPKKPLDLDRVSELYPTVRQSVLSTWDDCPLSSYFELAFDQGWSTHPQAAGTIFHRFAAECLRTMRTTDNATIPTQEALEILAETIRQRGLPLHERVRIPLREIPVLRMAAIKFAKDNKFTVRKIMDIEKRLEATLAYVDENGEIRERRLTGQPDVLIAEGSSELIIVDWKKTWALPPEKDPEAENPGISYHGYFQQFFYAWLIFKNYPSIKKVTLREFYAMRTKARSATLHRGELEKIEERLGIAVMEFDAALAFGKPKKLKLGKSLGPWQPQPGKHCSYCAASHRCPIPKTRRETIVVRTPEQASEAVAMLAVIEPLRKKIREALRPWVEENGPVAAKWSKGRLVFGLKANKNGRPDLKFFTPEGADRPIERMPEDRPMEDALRRAGEEARELKAGEE